MNDGLQKRSVANDNVLWITEDIVRFRLVLTLVVSLFLIHSSKHGSKEL